MDLFGWLKENRKHVAETVIETPPLPKHDPVVCDHDHNKHLKIIRTLDHHGDRTSDAVQCEVCGDIFKREMYGRYSYRGSSYDRYDSPEYGDGYTVFISSLSSSERLNLLRWLPLIKSNAKTIGQILGVITPNYTLVNYSDHNPYGYAITFSNGIDIKGICVIDGVIVPDKWVLNKDDLTFKDFISERNLEKRKRFVSLVGEDRLKSMVGESARKQNEEQIGAANIGLLSVHVDNMDIKVLRILNKWEENPYFLFVPPWIKTAREGIAWSFYQDPTEYNPVREA